MATTTSTVFISKQFPRVFGQQSSSYKDSWVQFPGVSGTCNLRIVKYPSQFLFEFAAPSSPEQVLLSAPCQLAYFQSPANLVLRETIKQRKIWVRFADFSQDKAITSFINKAKKLANTMHGNSSSLEQNNIDFGAESTPFGFTPVKVLSDLLLDEELSDQEIIFQDDVFNVNRSVLALNCNFFRDLWFLDFKDKHEYSLDLSNLPVSPSSFTSFIHSVYGQDAEINSHNAYEIYYLSHYFKCDALSSQITSTLNSSLLNSQYLSSFISKANKEDDLRALLFAGPFIQKVSSLTTLCLSTSFLVSINEHEFCGSKESLCWFVKCLVKSIEEDSFDCSELEATLNSLKIELIGWNDWNDLLLSPLEKFEKLESILMKFHFKRLRVQFTDNDFPTTQKKNPQLQPPAPVTRPLPLALKRAITQGQSTAGKVLEKEHNLDLLKEQCHGLLKDVLTGLNEIDKQEIDYERKFGDKWRNQQIRQGLRNLLTETHRLKTVSDDADSSDKKVKGKIDAHRNYIVQISQGADTVERKLPVDSEKSLSSIRRLSRH
ncbi:hypothetical protein GEMRC1_005275 [Eukaryota sp. GEM-RC1]